MNKKSQVTIPDILKIDLEIITDDWLILSVISYHFYLSDISFRNDNWRTDTVRNDNFDIECDCLTELDLKTLRV